TIVTSSSAKGIVFKAGSGNDSTSLFQLQNAAGQSMLNVDTQNRLVLTGQSDFGASGNLAVTGLADPLIPALTSSFSGGSLAAATYYYKLAAVNFHGTTDAIVPSPASVTTTGTTSKNTLSWTALTNATSYNVYRSTNNVNWFINNVAAPAT